MRKISQSGFAIIEAVLIVVVVGILSFTGWFVWHAKQNTDKSLDAANNSEQASVKTTKKTDTKQASLPVDETTNWLLYTTPSKEFSMRLADGWQLEECSNVPLLTTNIHDSVTPHPGTKAAVSTVNCASDRLADGLSISYVTGGSDAGGYNSPVNSFKIASGETVNLYSRIAHITANDFVGPGDLKDGGTYYSYLVTKAPAFKVTISYGVNPGQSDDHLTVEKAIKTMVIN